MVAHSSRVYPVTQLSKLVYVNSRQVGRLLSCMKEWEERVNPLLTPHWTRDQVGACLSMSGWSLKEEGRHRRWKHSHVDLLWISLFDKRVLCHVTEIVIHQCQNSVQDISQILVTYLTLHLLTPTHPHTLYIAHHDNANPPYHIRALPPASQPPHPHQTHHDNVNCLIKALYPVTAAPVVCHHGQLLKREDLHHLVWVRWIWKTHTLSPPSHTLPTTVEMPQWFRHGPWSRYKMLTAIQDP